MTDLTALRAEPPAGERVAVGFRPSGDLHVGNLLSVASAAVVADALGLRVDLQCCDTDWSAHIHEQTVPGNNRVMTPFFNRDCPCGGHRDVAAHHLDRLQPFLDGVRDAVSAPVSQGRLTKLAGDGAYVDALRTVLERMDAFDAVFGGGFRRRYRSPVVAPCSGCGHAHAKGGAYSPATDEVVAACRHDGCGSGFARAGLDGRIGVYYLVDPVRDPGRDVAVHVFGGDYRTAEKEQTTPKVAKVARITRLATGETPAYLLAPLIADGDGAPLSKSAGRGMTLAEIDDPAAYGRRLTRRARDWLDDGQGFVPQQELAPAALSGA